MNFGMILIPLSQVTANVQLTRRTFARLFNATKRAHPPVTLAGAPTGGDHVQPKLNETIDNGTGFDLGDGVPEGNLCERKLRWNTS